MDEKSIDLLTLHCIKHYYSHAGMAVQGRFFNGDLILSLIASHSLVVREEFCCMQMEGGGGVGAVYFGPIKE